MYGMRRTLTHKSRQHSISAESITFAIACLVVAVLVGLILLTWDQHTDDPPTLSIVRSGEIRAAQGQFYVPFTLKNTGGKTAESVQVIGELRQGGEVVEAGDQQIDFLSGGEEEEGAFIFTRDPDQGNLIIRVASYKLP